MPIINPHHYKYSSKIFHDTYKSVFNLRFMDFFHQEWWCRPVIYFKIQSKMKEKRNKPERSSPSTDITPSHSPFSLVFSFSNNILPETCDSFLSEYRLFYLTWWFVVLPFTHKWHNFIHIKIPYISAQKCHYETHHFIDFSDSKWWTDLFVLHMKNVHKSSMALENTRQYIITAKITYAVRLQAQLTNYM